LIIFLPLAEELFWFKIVVEPLQTFTLKDVLNNKIISASLCIPHLNADVPKICSTKKYL